MALVTRESVFSAAAALAEAGIKPTLQKVRDELGGGSFSTLSKFMDEYRAEQIVKAAPMMEPAPDSIKEKLDGILTELWATATGIANARLTADREALENTRKELERSQGEALELADQVSIENEQLQATLVKQAELVKAFESKVDSLVSAEIQLKEQLALASNEKDKALIRLEEMEKRLADHIGQIKDLKSEHSDAITKITVENNRLAKENNAKLKAVQDQLMTCQSKSDELLKENRKLELELSRLHQVAVQDSDTIKRLTSEVDSSQEKLAQLGTELKKTEQEKADALKEAASLAGQIKALTTKPSKKTNT